ncbi:MAG TPA: hypothetical protein VNY04_11545 [Chthoniobacterales bacterium]|nr:hypothetical protein [Chthoniobacterales bacterium]
MRLHEFSPRADAEQAKLHPTLRFLAARHLFRNWWWKRLMGKERGRAQTKEV